MESGYWLSYSVYAGPGIGYEKLRSGEVQYRIRMVSAVLDDEARFKFSAIRLLVISRVAGVTIADCADPLRDLEFPQLDDTGYRHRLSRRRLAAAQSRNFPLEGAILPICTIILEIAETSNQYEWWVRPGILLVPRSTLPSFRDYRVIYDHVQTITPIQPSIVLFLESNRVFGPLPGTTYLHNLGQVGVSALSIRVIPTDTTKRHVVRLPAKILRRIGEFCIGTKIGRWRAELLSYGLVCKAWLPLLDLFFHSFTPGRNFNRDPPDVSRVARCLKARPERGALMNNFGVHDYSQADSHFTVDDWHELMTIFKHVSVTALRGVSLCSVPTCVAEELADGLSRLRGVSSLTICNHFLAKSTVFDMTAIQSFIENWYQLRKLKLVQWAPSSGDSVIHEPLLPLPCKIEELVLHDGVLEASHLLRFTPSSGPCLKIFRLYKVNGITNAALASFLSIVAPTLTILEISHCQFTHSSHEELAIDASMPQMGALHRLLVTGSNVVTALALSRKSIIGQPGTPSHRRSTIMLSGVDEEMWLEEASAAIEVTGWDTISINWKDLGHHIDVGPFVESSLATATERGILLTYEIGDVGIILGTNVQLNN